MDLKAAEPVLLWGTAILAVGWVGWHLWTEHQATAAAASAQAAEITTSASMLVAGAVPLAPDPGQGVVDVLPYLPGTSVSVDPFTGSYAAEIDPTTGEVGIANVQDIG